jgi:hypothetical protein
MMRLGFLSSLPLALLLISQVVSCFMAGKSGRAVAIGRTAFFSTGTPLHQANTIEVVAGQPPYEIASIDLSRKWIELVRDDKVAATVNIPNDQNGGDFAVRYGVRLVARDSGTHCEEFVEEVVESSSGHELIQQISSTLMNLQEQAAESSSTSVAVQYSMDGDFAAQLQLVRTLRPPPSPGFSESTTSVPPEYDSSTDSFVTGPLRLELRPLVALLELPELTTRWDVFHNVSPADTRGHFLLLPTLSAVSNLRGQVMTKEDCNDLVHLTLSIKPEGALLVGFNSVGAGASQNHMHCHAWPSPPVPLMSENVNDNDDKEEVTGWNCYPVSRTGSIYDICDIHEGKVEVSYLKYPVFCVQLSATLPHLNLLGEALAVVLDSVGEAPYNVGFLNRPQEQDHDHDHDEDEHVESNPVTAVDIYVFVRAKERSSELPTLKLGISEMMGVFHAQSEIELQQLVMTSDDAEDDGPMMRALMDVSYEPSGELWETIKDNLMREVASN